jgi:tetratricopeptide (TPR) repeat protein
MKKVLVVIVFLLNLSLAAQSGQKIFEQANDQYIDGHYEKAIELYLSIEAMGMVSDDMYFNLGNCFYKQNNVARSIYYYEKALKINPRHEDAQINLAFAKRMTIDLIEELPKTVIQRFSENVIQKLPYDTWAVLAVIGSFLASLFFLLYHFSRSSGKKLLYFNSTIFVSIVVFITLFFAYNNYKTVLNNREAIIFAQRTEIMNAPSDDGELVVELHEGTKVLILDELEDWKKIKIDDGTVGWINTEDLEEI